MLVYADGDARAAIGKQPLLDVDASLRLASSLFASETLAQIDRETCPARVRRTMRSTWVNSREWPS